MQKGLVSIIVPAYNVECYIDKCLSSLVNQNYDNIEIIVVDDNSTDNTKVKLRSWSSNPKIKVIYNDNQSGPSKARNLGIDVAKGEYIVFTDADDWMELDAINNLLAPMKSSNEIDIVFSNFNFVYDDGRITLNNPISCNTEIPKIMIAELALKYLKSPNKFLLFSHSWSIMFKTEKIGDLRFDENLFSFEDMDFNFRYLPNINKAYYTTQLTYNHLVRGGNYASTAFSINHGPREKLFGYLTALPKLIEFIINYGKDRLVPWVYEDYGQAFSRLTIIQLIRVCGQLSNESWKPYKKFIDDLIKKEDTQQAIRFYKRRVGESRIIPWLIRRRLTYLLMKFCQRKAKKRYG